MLEEGYLSRSEDYFRMLRKKVGFGWKCSLKDISFSDIEMTYFLGIYAVMVCAFITFGEMFSFYLIFLPFLMQMVDGFSHSTGFIHTHF